MLSLLGIGVFVVFFFGMRWRCALRWRYLAEAYSGPSLQGKQPAPIEERGWQNAVLIGLSGFQSLRGIVTFGVHETGLSMRVLAPFALFHPPLFIPYSDIRGWRTTWYLDAPSTELEFVRAPNVKIVVPTEQATWIKRFSGQKMLLRDVPPAHGNAGRGWYALNLVHAGFSIFAIVSLSVLVLSRWP